MKAAYPNGHQEGPLVSAAINSVDLAIFQSGVHSIAEEMGAALRRTAISPNIKERRDYSCALFDRHRRVIAMGDHMPVHLGSMPLSVKAVVAKLDLQEGDIAILNDPYAGGTHLPDITLVLPIFIEGVKGISFYAATRAHHADVGGTFAGSMGPAREICQEGIRIPPLRLVQGGKLNEEILSLILHNVRTPEEREAISMHRSVLVESASDASRNLSLSMATARSTHCAKHCWLIPNGSWGRSFSLCRRVASRLKTLWTRTVSPTFQSPSR